MQSPTFTSTSAMRKPQDDSSDCSPTHPHAIAMSTADADRLTISGEPIRLADFVAHTHSSTCSRSTCPAYPFFSQGLRHGLSRPPRPCRWQRQRGMQPPAVRREKRLETDHLHALFKSPLVRAAHSPRVSQPALQSRWPAASR
eukprot:2497979-Prymnesium_polylepis.1